MASAFTLYFKTLYSTPCTLIWFYFPSPENFFSNVTLAMELWNHRVLDWNHVTRHMEGSYGHNGTVMVTGDRLWTRMQSVNSASQSSHFWISSTRWSTSVWPMAACCRFWWLLSGGWSWWIASVSAVRWLVGDGLWLWESLGVLCNLSGVTLALGPCSVPPLSGVFISKTSYCSGGKLYSGASGGSGAAGLPLECSGGSGVLRRLWSS